MELVYPDPMGTNANVQPDSRERIVKATWVHRVHYIHAYMEVLVKRTARVIIVAHVLQAIPVHTVTLN